MAKQHLSRKEGGKADCTEDSFYAHRCKRLKERIGVAEPNTVTIADREFEIFDYSSEDLIVGSAQLLQGRPLEDAVEFFIYGAIHFALVGNGATQETQSWLNILNDVDPEETAAGLRSASQAIRSLPVESGHHPDLNARIASILLWRTGYSEDAQEAWRKDPKIDHNYEYGRDYLSDPSRSFFRLERRHVGKVLYDKTLAMFGRIERSKDALLDPSFQVPQEFIDELTSVSEGFDFSQTATGRGRTAEDVQWERLSLALARCNPNRLADCERTRLRQYAERTADQRFGSGLTAPDVMLLVRGEESAALQTLRERESGESDDDEVTIQARFLIAEIQCASPLEQVTKILNSEMDPLVLDLVRACHSPSARELDQLVDSCCGDERKLSRLATILAEHDLDLSQDAFDAFSELLFSKDEEITPGAAWLLLGSNAAERLGSMLDQSGWSWSSSKPHLENIMGSKAVAAAHRNSSFSTFAARIAPFKLLATLSQGERSREEVRLAVDLLSAALFQYDEDAPESGLDIFYDYEAASTGNYNFTIGDIVEDRDDENDVHSFFKRAGSPEQYEQRRRAIIQSYIDAVRRARESGAQLLHTQFHAEDFDLALGLCPEALDRWLEGMDAPTDEFRRRVRLAEGFFFGLCEAVLTRDPSRGIPLWRTLRQCIVTRFIGPAGIDSLKYAPFKAPDCPTVTSALEELCILDEAQTDEDLFDIVVAARMSGRVDWLRQKISADESSSCPAHRRRAAFLQPLLTRPTIAGDINWPGGPPIGGYQEIHDRAWIMGQREAFAAHWFRKFAEADTPEAAHAFWLLFVACCDRRAKTWMPQDYKQYAAEDGSIEAPKRQFVQQQMHHLKRAMTENEKSLNEKFTTERVTKSLLPWKAR